MHDLATIKRLNRTPSKRGQPGNRQDKPAPQPARGETASYDFRARRRVLKFAVSAELPAMDREPLDHA